MMEVSNSNNASQEMSFMPGSWSVVLGSLENFKTYLAETPLAMLERMAEHASTPLEVLTMLSSWPNPDVRAAVSENHNCTGDILSHLAHDQSPDVRYRLAENPAVPKLLLEELLEDENCYVAHRAKKTLDRMKAGDAPIQAVITLRREGGRLMRFASH